MRFVVLLLTVTGFAAAQDPPAPAPPPAASERPLLTNTGAAIKAPVNCGTAEIEQLGLPCSLEEPCPVYLELAAADAFGDRIVVSGNLHTSTATVSSILLASDDGGKTWYEPHERIPSAGLDQMQVLDLEVGWVAGQVMATLPRDPFFLLTANGGKTWSRRPIFSETRVGTVDQFWFENRTAGSLTVDRTQTGDDGGGRHELYESMTGGESWMLRQVSTKAIPLKRGRPAGSATWRVRADGTSKSYCIERRQVSGWSNIASFLIVAGECRPTEKPAAEPPPLATEPPAPSLPPVSAPRKPPTLKKKL